MSAPPSRNESTLSLATAENIGQLAHWRAAYLERLRNFLNTLESEASAEIERARSRFICWDWDMIRDYMRPGPADAVFAGALIRTLDLTTDEFRVTILILDGARREIRSFLAQKARRYRLARLSEHAKTRESQERIAAKGALADPDWDAVRHNLDRLGDYRSVRRLETFLSEKAVSLGQVDAEFARKSSASIRRTSEFSEAYRVVRRRSGSRRNTADALNIARVMLAQEEGHLAQLVTGTNRFLDGFSDLCADPILSLASHLVRRAYPDPVDRQRMILRWHERVLGLLRRCTTVEEGAQATKRTTRQRVLNLANELQVFRGDASLAPLIRILSESSVLSRSHSERLPAKRARDAERALARVPDVTTRRVERKVLAVLDTLLDDEDQSPPGMDWIRLSGRPGVTVWELHESTTKTTVLRIEAASGRYSLQWPVDITFFDFLRCVDVVLNNKWVPMPDSIDIEILFAGPLIRTFSLKRSKKRWALVARVDLGVKTQMIRSRLITGRDTIYYEPAGTELESPAMAAVVGNDESLRWFLTLFDETSSTGLPTKRLGGFVRSRVDIWERETDAVSTTGTEDSA